MLAIKFRTGRFLGFLLAMVPTASLSAQTNWTLTPDRDATLYEDAAGTLANGSGTAMFVGTTNFGGKRRRQYFYY